MTLLSIILLIAGLAAGMGAGYAIRNFVAKQKTKSAEEKANRLLEEAKTKEKETILSAKDKAVKIMEEAKATEEERQKHLRRLEERLENKEESLDKKYDNLERKEEVLTAKAQEIKALRTELEELKKKQLLKLEKIADLPKEKAEEILLERTEQQMKEKLLVRIKKLEEMEREELKKKAQKIISTAIERTAVDHATESTATVVDIPSDELKGRIIGREGRNIRALENLTGVEVVVDDTPGAIIISGFNPIRRQVAKLALEKLISDGRIHPAKIEEAVKKSKQAIAENIKAAGDAVLYDLGIAGIEPKLTQILGRLKYRTSYGQNVLRHSLEVAHLSAILAEELGADVAVAKKAGLFHDIGKAVDQEVQGKHTDISVQIGKKFGFPEDILHAIEAHHEDVEAKTVEAVIVKVADAISASRPGARRDSYEDYITRLTELEDLAAKFEGVEKTYAIQAGREVRVFVMPEKIDDFGAKKLAADIAKKVEEELKYPGEIKVNVIRETRAIEFAK